MVKKHNFKKIFATSIFLVCFSLLFLTTNALGQGGIELTQQSMDYRFGDYFHFEARFDSSSELVNGQIVIQVEDAEDLLSFEATLGPNGEFLVEINANEEFSPPAFQKINYWYLVANKDGNIFESQRFQLAYEDNRFSWQSVENDHFVIYWHSGKNDFGQSILDSAENGISSTQSILPLAGPTGVEIYVYESQEELQKLMDSANYSWRAGHSDLEKDRVYLSIGPGPAESLEIARQVPHEVAHIMLFQALGAEAYYQLPKWLDEGIASNAEAFSDPLQNDILELLQAEGSLPGFFSLCNSFPQDPNLARISYSLSNSFVDFLKNEYRVVGIGAIVDTYAQNEDCMFGLTDLLGKNLLQLELDWQASVFESSTFDQGINDEISWIEIGALVIILALLIWLNRRRNRI